METRANYALIGLFTLLVVASAFGFVYWFSGGERGQGRQQIRIVFAGSVSGLSKGSVVLFNGIRVGEVTDISLLPEDPRRVVSIVGVDPNTPIRTDTRARLEYQGLTGVAQIGLSGGEPTAPPLVAGPGQPLPTIFADRSDFQDLLESARNIARRADDVLERVGRVVSDNEAAVARTIQNAERFSQALSDNAPGIDRLLEQVGQAAERIGPLAEKLETLATNVDDLVKAVDRQQVARIVENVDGFTENLKRNGEVLTMTMNDAASLVARLNETAPKLDSTISDINAIIRAVDSAKVGRTVDNIDRITREAAERIGPLGDKLDSVATEVDELVKSVDRQRVARIVENVDTFTQTLGENRQVLTDTFRDAASLVARLNDTAPKLDQALADIGNLARSVDTEKIGRTVDNIDRFADTLGRSSDDVEKTIADARSIAEKLNKSADRVDNVLKAAEGFLGTGEEQGSSTFAEIREAARSIRQLADNLDKRTSDISTGVNRFTNSGLREVEALAVEGRRTLNDISRAVKGLERNPQQLIFGGRPSIPEYNGRR
jgi:phospholipid/cholesterol/gamma-HCH transport system substrate-binding protein